MRKNTPSKVFRSLGTSMKNCLSKTLKTEDFLQLRQGEQPRLPVMDRYGREYVSRSLVGNSVLMKDGEEMKRQKQREEEESLELLRAKKKKTGL